MNVNFLAWLRQGTTQTGLSAIMVSVMGYFSGALPLEGLLPALAVGIAGLFWPESGAVKQHVLDIVSEGMALAETNPRLAAVFGHPVTAPATAPAPAANTP